MDSEKTVEIKDTTQAFVTNGEDSKPDSAATQALVDTNGDLKSYSESDSESDSSSAEEAIEINGDLEPVSNATQALVTNGDSKPDSAATQALVDINEDLKSDSESDSSSAEAALEIDGDLEPVSDATQGLDNNNNNNNNNANAEEAIEIDGDLEPVSDATQSLDNNNNKTNGVSETDYSATGESQPSNHSRSSSSQSSSSSSSISSSSEECFQIGISEEATEPDDRTPSDGDQPNKDLASPAPAPRVTFQIAEAPPAAQAMERSQNKEPSTGYRIPSYVFARTKSTAPGEWSTASNESLFSIHTGNASFNRDHLFFQGKSGDLGGLSNPFLDNNNNYKPSRSVPNSVNSDEQSRAEAEARVAEVMREVIRESSANDVAKPDTPVSPNEPSAISRHKGESTKSFAFPVLAGGDGDKSLSPRVGAVPAEQQKQQAGTLKATLVAPSDSPKVNQIVAQNRFFSFPCFTCCRPSCY